MRNNLKLLFVVALLNVGAVVTPVRAWVPMFVTFSFVLAVVGLYGNAYFRRVCPGRLLAIGFVFLFYRAMQGAIKYSELTSYYIRLTLGNMLYVFLSITVIFAIIAYADYKQFRKFVIAMLIMTFPFLLITIVADVGVSRTQMAVAVQISEQAVQEAEEVNRSGVMMYGAIHSLMFIAVAAVMQIRNLTVKRDKVLFALFAATVVLTVIRSGFGYATYVTILLVVLSLAGTKRLSMVLMWLAIAAILFLILWKTGVLVAILDAVQQGFGYQNVIGSKAEELAAILGGRVHEASDFYGRFDIYDRSWQEFLRHPFWGTDNQTRLGGHAYWIDMLGQWGFTGFVVEALMHFVAYRYVLKALPRGVKYYFVICVVAFVGICLVKNGAFHAQVPILFGMAVPMLLLREDDFYVTSNNIRRMFRLPPRMWGRF